eukprot:5842619-Amphidinium_carterae.1
MHSTELFGALSCSVVRHLRMSRKRSCRSTWQHLTPPPGVSLKGDPQNFLTNRAASTRREAPGVPT